MNNAATLSASNGPIIEMDPQKQAMYLYWQGFRIARIAEILGENPSTVHSWKQRGKWDETSPLDRCEGITEARYIQLVNKPEKEGKDFKEIDLLGRQMERMARINKYNVSSNEVDLNPNIASRNSKPKKKQLRNNYSDEQLERLKEIFFEGSFDYQLEWYQAGLLYDIRNLLKSRQIGATLFFSREAGLDAATTGRNQLFISASKAQAYIFRKYIVDFFAEADIELTGDPIILPNGAEMHFLGTNSKTAQGFNGNLYFDEYMWVSRFLELYRVTSGMALQDGLRITAFSTPSSISHEGYRLFSGMEFNQGRTKKDRVELDISHAALKGGRLGPDDVWRQIVTIEDAVAGGNDRFNLEKLRRRYSPQDYANLLMCEFVDDHQSIFPMAMMQKCMVDSWEVWADFFEPLAHRPVGQRNVWVGYDPNGEGDDGDNAGLVVILPAKNKDDKHRIIEKHQFRGMDYQKQADQIKEICGRYNVSYIGIDVTGIGSAVAQLVRKFHPNVKEFRYSPEVKVGLVNKSFNIISKGRLEYDSGWTDISSAFMAIRRQVTASGSSLTYNAGRNGKIGHADLAWATMHALDKDELDGDTNNNQSFMEFS